MRSILCWSILGLFAGQAFSSEHKKIKSFSEVGEPQLDATSLVVSDINDTLLTCKEPLWQKATMDVLSLENKNILSKFTPLQKNLLANLLMQKCSNTAMGGGVEFFSALKTKKVPSVALTAAYAEPLDGVDMEQFITTELKREGYTFGSYLAERKEFTNLKRDQGTQAFPLHLATGVLLTNGTENSKGEVLKAYLESLPKGQVPKLVLYFDDSSAHLDSVAKAMTQFGIEVKTCQMVGYGSFQGLKSPSPREERVWQSLLIRVGKN